MNSAAVQFERSELWLLQSVIRHEMQGGKEWKFPPASLDLTEACNGFTDPDYYYPGVDEGIEPVTDEHVSLVIWGALRELKRELRQRNGGFSVRPHAPIDELPWRFQRAFAERRRLRYSQWGIGRAEWETNQWSLWSIPEDADWIPAWVTK